jgi:formyltetrahydrofolate-dependent phosphoribosylglycinamide formyltransferase
MAALVEGMRSGRIPADPAIVVSNVPGAPGLAAAASWGIPAEVVDHTKITPRDAHERELLAVLGRHRVEIVCLAGYMRLLTPLLLETWSGRMLNIHPSLLPAFPGLDTHARALAAGVKLHGCTVHLVTQATDEGPILAQAAVPVLPGDTTETLAARVLVQEHRIYPIALRGFVAGVGGQAPPGDAALVNAAAHARRVGQRPVWN